MTSRYPISRVLIAPDPPESGLTLSVVEDDGDMFPNAPFRAIAFRNQEVPDIGTDSCYITVTAVNDDVFTFTREDPTVSILGDMNISVVSEIPTYDFGATVRITGIFPDGPGDAAGVLTIISPLGELITVDTIATGKIVVVGPGDYYYDLVVDAGGLWSSNWVGPEGETVQSRKFFVRFS